VNQQQRSDRCCSLARSGIRYQALARTRVGAGAILWMRIAPAAERIRLSTQVRSLRYEETGVVARIDAFNPSADPVLVPAHLVLRGGRQTRVVERSLIVAPGARASIPVKCVERGRWSPESPTTSDRLSGSEHSSVITRHELATSKYGCYRETGAYMADQSSLWRHVDDELTRSGIESATSSYGAYLSSVQLRARHGAGTTLRAPADVNAVLLLCADWLAFEAYPSPAALRDRLPALLADMPDADDAPVLGGTRRAMAALWHEALEPIPPVADTLGEIYAVGSLALAGEVALMDGAMVHASISQKRRSA
jgi:hypothetical protein